MRNLGKRLAGSSVFLFILLLWYWGSRSPQWNHFLLPSPERVGLRGWQLLTNGLLLRHLSASLFRVLSGFFISLCLAFPLGVFLAVMPRCAAFFRPLLNFLRQIPPLAVVPLLILGLGIGEASRVAVVVMASFFPILLSVESGVRNIDASLMEVGKSLCFTRVALFRRIAFPLFFPMFLTGIRLALSYSWRSLIGAEIVAASSGLGYMIREAETLSRSDTIICGVLLLGFIGSSSDWILGITARKLFPWSEEQNDGTN